VHGREPKRFNGDDDGMAPWTEVLRNSAGLPFWVLEIDAN